MQTNFGAGLGHKLLASSLALLVVLSISPYGVLAADLSNPSQTTTAPASGVIRIGGQVMTIRAGQPITDAQRIALMQVISAGRQSLLLNSAGTAIGGRFDVGSVSNVLNIPAGVTALQNVANTGAQNLTGNLNNAGSYYLYSTNANATLASISAANIINNAGALLSTVLPSSLSLAGALPRLDLGLSAAQNIVNAGTISSSGNLSLAALGALQNSGTLQSAANLNIAANNITNSGLISATAGNITINPGNTGSITVNNAGGTIQALLGDINVREAGYSHKSNFLLSGGDIFARGMNVESGNGIVQINVGELSPAVNVNAGEAHIVAATKNLVLGEINTTGDPNIYNTAGNVSLTDDINTNGADLAIVAAGDIVVGKAFANNPPTADVKIALNTSSATGNGGALTLIAGALFTVQNGTTGSQIGGGAAFPPLLGDNSILTITGGSALGGRIDLNKATPVTTGTPPNTVTNNFFQTLSSLSTAATGATGNGGNLTIVAYKGTATNSGSINLPTGNATTPFTINVTGATGGTNGNVLAIASGGTTVAGLFMGGINANGTGTTGGGNIELYGAAPGINNGPLVINNGTITQGQFAPGTLANTSLVVSGTTNAKGAFTAKAGGPVAVIPLKVGNPALTATGNIEIQAGNRFANSLIGIQVGGLESTTGDIKLTTTANNSSILITGNVKAAGNVEVTAHGVGQIMAQSGQTAQYNTPVAGNQSYILGGTLANGNIYIPNYNFGSLGNNNGSIVVMNQATGSIVTTISGIDGPQGTAATPNGAFVFVATGIGLTKDDGAIKVIDTNTNTIVATAVLGADKTPQTVAVAGNRLYVLEFNTTTNVMDVRVFDITTPTSPVELATIALPNSKATGQAGGIVVNQQGTLLYASSPGNNLIYSVNVSNDSNSLISTINLAPFVDKTQMAMTLGMTPDGTKVFVAEGAASTSAAPIGNILSIDSAPNSKNFNRVLSNISLPQTQQPRLGSFPQGLAVTATGIEVMAPLTYLSAMIGLTTATGQPYEGSGPPLFLIDVGSNGGFIQPRTGPDNYGATNWSTIGVSNGVPVERTFTFNTMNVSGVTQTVSVIDHPTIQSGGPTSHISLSSSGGQIVANYDTKGGTLTANTTGAGAVILGNVGSTPSTLGASSAPGNLFQLGSIGSVNVTGGINSPFVLLGTTQSGDLNIASTVGQDKGTTKISTVNGNVIQQTGGLIKGATIQMNSVNGSFGTTTPLSTVTTSLSALTNGTGSVNISNVGKLTLGVSSAGPSFKLFNDGALTIPTGSKITASSVDLATTAKTGDAITINGAIGNAFAPGAISIHPGSGRLTQGGGTHRIIGNSFDIDVVTGNIGASAAAPLRITGFALPGNLPADLTLSTPGSAYISDDNASVGLNLKDVVVPGTFTVKALNDISVSSTIPNNMRSTAITLDAGGKILLNNSIGVPDVSTITLTSRGITDSAITASNTNVVVNGKTLTMTATKGNSQIGSLLPVAIPINTNASTVTANAGAAGVVNLNGFGDIARTKEYAMTLKATGDNVNVLVDGKLTTASAIPGTNVRLETRNSGSGNTVLLNGSRELTIGGNIGAGTSGTTVFLRATNSGVTSTGKTNIIEKTGTISAGDIELRIDGATDTGSIGAATKPILTKGVHNSLDITAIGGGAFVKNTGDVELDQANVSGQLTLQATKDTKVPGDSGKITVASAITTPGSLTLQSLGSLGAIEVINPVQVGQNFTAIAGPTGNVAIQADITAANAITLTAATGTVTQSSGATTITTNPAEKINITTGTGTIGTSLQPLQFGGGDVYVKSTAPGIWLKLMSDNAGLGTISDTKRGATLNVTTDTANGVAVHGAVNVPNVTVTSKQGITSSNNPLFTVGGGGTVVLTAENGAVGDTLNPVFTKATQLALSATGGAVQVLNTGNVTLQDSGATGDFFFANSGTTALNNVSGDNVTLRNTTGTMTRSSGVITGTTSVEFQSRKALTGTNAALTGTGSFGTNAATPLFVDTPTFSSNTNGKVFAQQSGTLPDVGIEDSTASSFSFTSVGNLHVNGPINSPVVSLTAFGTGSTVSLDSGSGVVGSPKATSVMVYADGNILGGPGSIQATNVTLQSLNGSVGTSAVEPIGLKTANLTLGFTDSKDVFIDNSLTGLLTFKGYAIGTTTTPNAANFSLISDGAVAFAKDVKANTLSVNSGGDMTTATKVSLITPNADLVADAGNIKVVTMNPSATTATLNAEATNGAVSVTNSGGTGLNVSGLARKAFAVTDSSGVLNVTGNIDTGLPADAAVGSKITGNNVTLLETASGGTIFVNDDVTANGGSIVINVPNATAASGITMVGTTLISTLVSKTTAATNGNITIALGKLPTTGTNAVPLGGMIGSKPVATVTAPGKVFAGVNAAGINGNATGSLNAAGRSIIFNAPTGMGTIALGDSTVTADPPGMGTTTAGTAVGGTRSSAAPSVTMPAGESTTVPAAGIHPSALAGASNIVNVNNTNTLVPTNVNASGAPVNPFKPIAFVSGSATAFARAAEARGLSLYAPTEDTVIETAVGKLHVGAGAAVLAVMQPSGTVSIFNLHDNGNGDVTLETGGSTTTLHPGEHVTVAAGTGTEFGDVNPLECISHRDMRALATKDGNAMIYTSEFSITSALKGLPSLLDMRHSKNGAERKVANGIVKTAASLMQLGASKGAYQRFATPRSRVTAMQ